MVMQYGDTAATQSACINVHSVQAVRSARNSSLAGVAEAPMDDRRLLAASQ